MRLVYGDTGWKLLQMACPMPECGTPLLQDQEENVYCAGCQLHCLNNRTLAPPAAEDPIEVSQGTSQRLHL